MPKKPKTKKDALWFCTLGAACLLSGIAGLFFKNPHPHFELEVFPLFFGLYGFLVFSGIVLIGQHLRLLVGKKETYYDERE